MVNCFVPYYLFQSFQSQLTLPVSCFLLQSANQLIVKVTNQLVENIGVEPMTSCLQSRRSSQLS